MTDEEALELGKRWNELGLPWMPGMLFFYPVVVEQPNTIFIDEFYYGEVYQNRTPIYGIHAANLDISFPDFRDPATLGCLISSVCDAWKDFYVHICYEAGVIISVSMYEDDNYRNSLFLSTSFGPSALIEALDYWEKRVIDRTYFFSS